MDESNLAALAESDPGANRPKVAILTVNYNGAAFLPAFLHSLDSLSYRHWHLILVDCASTDGSADAVQTLGSRATLIRLGENRGITGGNNAGIDEALRSVAGYVLFLNPDTRVTPELLDALLALAAPGRLVAPCVLLEGSENLLDDNAGDFDWRRGVWRDWRFGRVRPEHERPRRVGMVSLVCLLVPAVVLRELIARHGHAMDPRYFMYYDDFDFVRRLQDLGCEAYYAPDATLYHRKSAAGGGVDSSFKHYYATRNRLYLVRSVTGWLPFSGFFVYFALGRMMRMAQALSRRRPSVALAMLRGMSDFLAGRTGRTVLPERGNRSH